MNNDYKIQFHEKFDSLFSIIQGGETLYHFYIRSNKRGNHWIELPGGRDDFFALLSFIENRPDATITTNDKMLNLFKYSRNNCAFSMQYIEYVDPWIDPFWDGKSFIAFRFVEREHPDFKLYLREALCLLERKEIPKSKLS